MCRPRVDALHARASKTFADKLAAWQADKGAGIAIGDFAQTAAHGEIVVLDPGGAASFARLQAALLTRPVIDQAIGLLRGRSGRTGAARPPDGLDEHPGRLDRGERRPRGVFPDSDRAKARGNAARHDGRDRNERRYVGDEH